jgi:Peptidase propeptide and YPEB domain
MQGNWSQRMYNRKFLMPVFAVTVIGCACGVMPGLATAKSGVEHKAKISLSQARAIALKAYPGQIMKEELEHERGGSGLRYSFDMRRGKQWREVGVDAKTGRIIENIREGANPKD